MTCEMILSGEKTIMIYLTGDIHRTQDIAKILPQNFNYEGKTRDDYLFIAGDFGCIWTGDEHDARLLDWFASLPLTVLWIDGNHENFDLINALPVEMWHGGKVHRVRSNLLHLMRGQVYEIDGKTWFTFGGGASMDRGMRKIHVSWWPQEMPSEAETEEGFRNLEAHHWHVDYIVSHCAPMSILRTIVPVAKGDQLNRYLEEVREKTVFRHWYFGHYHKDMDFDGKYSMLFSRIVVPE